MIARGLLVFVLLAPTVAMAQSTQTCPWLTAGTAAGILGNDVSPTAHIDSNWSGSCRFVTPGNKDRSIEVTVSKTAPHGCGPGATSVPAIGNEAALCSEHGAGRVVVQILTGRVRDAWFVVKLVLPSAIPEASSGTEPSDSSAIKFLAEQVSGNLY